MLGWLKTECAQRLGQVSSHHPSRPGTNDGRGERAAVLCSLWQIPHCDIQVHKAVTAKQRGAAMELRIPSLAAWVGKGNPSPSSQPWVFNKCPVLQKHPKWPTDIWQRGAASSAVEASTDPCLCGKHRVRFPSLAHSLPNQTETQLHAEFVTICGLQFDVVACVWSHLF